MGSMTTTSQLRVSTEVSPLRHVRDITYRSQGKDTTAFETYRALPSPPQPYSTYDYAVIAEIIRTAEAVVAKAYKRGKGSAIVTLQAVLHAYEAVLPRHGVKPDADTYYYRLLLKLSLDPHLDWWAKLNRETGGTLLVGGAGSPARPSSPYRSPTRPHRASGNGAASDTSAAPTVRGGVPSIAGGRIPGRNSPYRTTSSLARASDYEVAREGARQAAARAAAQAAAAAAAASAAVNAARSAAEGAAQPPASRFLSNSPPLSPAGASAYGGLASPEGAPGDSIGGGWGSPYGPGGGGGAGGLLVPYRGSGGGASQFGRGSSHGGGPGSPYGGSAPGSPQGPFGADGLGGGASPRGASAGGAAVPHWSPRGVGTSTSGGGAGSPYGDSSAFGPGGGGGGVGGGGWGSGDGGGGGGRGSGGVGGVGGGGRGSGDGGGGGGRGSGGGGGGGGGGRGSGGGGGGWGSGGGGGIGTLAGQAATVGPAGPAVDDEAEAFLDFNRLARTFRAWRKVAFLRRTARFERDQALENWAVATSFWAINLLKRCFERWRAFGPRKALLALEIWGGNSLAGCFRRWLVLTRHLRSKGVESDAHWRRRLLRGCWRRWRQFASEHNRKAFAKLRALDFWAGRSLRGSFLLWRLLVQQARNNWRLSGRHLLRRMLLKWRVAARMLARLSAAHGAIQRGDQRRLMLASLRGLKQARAASSDTAKRLRAAVVRMRNATLSRAFNKWDEARQLTKWKRERLRTALGWSLALAWNAWREAVASSRRAMQVARDHALRLHRPLLRQVIAAWLGRLDSKVVSRSYLAEARGAMQARKARLVLRSLRARVAERRDLTGAFQIIMRNEVRRLVGQSLRCWVREHDNVRRAVAAQRALQRGAARRCLRHWKTLTEAREVRQVWRAERLQLAALRRKRRALTAWQLVAALLAEHGRLVHANLVKLHRRQATTMLRLWRGRVLAAMQQRMKVLAALLYWEGGIKARAWRGWRHRMALWHGKAHRFALAARHHRTRRLSICFAALLALWQDYQALLMRALLYRSMRNDVLKGRVIQAWRQLVGWLQWKNDKRRRAMVHARSRLLGGALYGWYAVTQHRQAVKRALAVAVLHWARRRRTAALLWWRHWAAHRLDLRVRGAGYALLRAGRAKERAVLALKANVIRKARIAGAQAHHDRYVARLALSGWLLRTLLAADFLQRLRTVGVQLGRQLQADTLAAWRDFTSYRRYKRGMLHAALRYWRLGRQRSALDCLRWNATRRQLERAVLLRGRLGAVSRALQAWRNEAGYRRRLRDRYALLMSGNRREVLRRGLDRWRAYLDHRGSKRDLRSRAVRHWLHGAAGRAFNGWLNYHNRLRDATERTGLILRRWRNRDAALALAAFAENVASRRQKRAAAELFRRTRTLQAIRAWRDFLKLQTAVGFWSGNRLAEAFATWRRFQQRSRALETTAGKVAARWRNRLAASAMLTWSNYTERKRRLKQLGSVLAGYTRRGTLASAVRAWRAHSSEKTRLKAIGSQLMNRTDRGMRRACLTAMRAYTGRQRFLRSVSLNVSGRTLHLTLAAAFRAWRAYKAYAVRVRAVGSGVAKRFLYGTLSGIVRAWHTWASNSRRLRAMGSMVANVFRRFTVGGLFTAWREHAAYASRVREVGKLVANRFRRYTVGGIFLAWRNWAADGVRRRAMGSMVANVFRRFTVGGLFTAWREHAVYASRVREVGKAVANRFRRFLVGGIFQAWHNWAADRVRLRGMGKLVANVFRRFTVGGLFTAWREHAAYASRVRDVGKLVANRFRRGSLDGIFQAWHNWAADRARLRGMGKLVANVFRRFTVGGLFTAWREYTLLALRLGAIGKRVTNLFARGTLGGVLLAWRTHTVDARRRRAIGTTVANVFRRFTRGGLFLAWREYTAFAIRVRAVGKLVAGRFLRSALGGIFQAWRTYATNAKRRRAMGSSVAKVFRRFTVGGFFLAWREHTAYMARVRDVGKAVANCFRRFAVGGIFQAWRNWAGDSVRRRGIGEAVGKVFRRGTVGGIFTAWREHTAYASRVRDVGKLVANRVRRGALGGIFLAWRNWATDRVRLRGIGETVGKVFRRNTVGGVFTEWRKHTVYVARVHDVGRLVANRFRRGALGGIVQAWRHWAGDRVRRHSMGETVGKALRRSTAGGVFIAWRQHAVYVARVRDVGKVVANRFRRGALGGIVQAWRNWAGDRVRRRGMGETVGKALRRSTAGGVFTAWRRYATTTRTTRKVGTLVASRLRRSTLGGIFTAWRQYAAYVSRVFAVGDLVASRLRRGTLDGIFGAWHAHASKMARLKGLLIRVLMRSSALAFYGWRELVARAKALLGQQLDIEQRLLDKPELADVVRYSAARMRNWPLALAFYTWYDNAKQARYVRVKTTHAVFAYAGGLLRKAWVTWVAFLQRNRFLRQKLRRFVAALGCKTASFVLAEWREVVRYQDRLRRIAGLVHDRWLGRTLRGFFKAWQHTTERWSLLRGILVRIMARQLAAAWDGWREAVANRREQLAVVQGIVARWTHRDLAAAFNSWCALVVRRAGARRLATKVLGRLLDWAWLTWRDAVFDAAVERGGALHEERLVVRVWRGWRAVAEEARRGRELAAVLQQRLALQALEEWRRQWLGRAAFRRLLTRRALLGWHARTQELRLARQKLWNAARFFLYGSLMRCFSAWWQQTQQRQEEEEEEEEESEDARAAPPPPASAAATGAGGGGGGRRPYVRRGSAASGGSVASTGFSSGARGADLTDRALHIVRESPGMLSPGKGRGPASGLTPAHIHLATASRGPLGSAARQRPAVLPDLDSSPYNDRLDLRTIHSPGPAAGSAAAAPSAFGGFAAGRQPAASPMPMHRGATPLTASAPIAPRRIDFTAGRTAAPAAAPYGAAYYGYGTSQDPYSAAEESYGGGDGSDTASTTSSDLLGPAAARARATAARAGGGSAGLSRQSSVTLGGTPSEGLPPPG
ncbi:ATP-dependent RNA helicase glh-2, partial [Tetrabaena socialis]